MGNVFRQLSVSNVHFSLLLLYTVLYFVETPQTLKKNLKYKKRAIRLIANITNTASCKPFFKKLRLWQSLFIYIYIYEILAEY